MYLLRPSQSRMWAEIPFGPPYLILIEIGKKETGLSRVHGPAAARPFFREKAIEAERQVVC
jgi:hypothetical protein